MAELDCDFYAFSGHKLFGPTGIGVLYGKQALLDAMPPYHGGGDMIKMVTFEKTLYNDLPYKFEAGTPYIAGVIGLGAAVDYVNRIDMDRIRDYEHELLQYAARAAADVPGLKPIGTAAQKAGILSFVMDGIHPHDLGTILDHEGIAIRTGHHCAMPVMERYGIPATARASFAFYNTREEVDKLVAGIGKAKIHIQVAAMFDLKDLYQEVIVDHNRNPRNFGKLDPAGRTLEGFNPLCGDRLTLYLNQDGNRISDIKFNGSGCAISIASASLMTEGVMGKSVQEAGTVFADFHELLTASDLDIDMTRMGKLAVLAGVREYPSRVKCATLCWHTLRALLDGDDAPVSTE